MKLNLGCGLDRLDGFVNVDIEEKFKPDKILDLNKFPYPFDDDCVDEIRMYQVLEHLDDVIMVIKECHRILKRGGVLDIKVPNVRKNDDAFNCDHKHFFSKKSFQIFYNNDPRADVYPKFNLVKLKGGSDIWIILQKPW
jgi:predicted SAM-dependent methyltransferase